MRQIYSPLDGFRSPFGRLMGSTAPFTPAVLFGASEPGVWYDPSDVANLAWRRNLLTFTEQFDNAAWAKDGATVAISSGPQEWYFANNGVATQSILSQAVSPSESAIFAIDLKADTIRYVRLRYTNVTNATTADLDLQTGSSTGLPLTDVGGGFYRAYLPFTSGADNTGLVNIYLSDTSGGQVVVASASKRIIVRRPQFELGSVATDYQRISDVNTEVIERFPSATLYQDTAGTIPVTGPAKPDGTPVTVALALDKSKGLVLGSELVTDPNTPSDWVAVNNNTVTQSGAGVIVTNVNSTFSAYVQLSRLGVSLELGKRYKISFTARTISGAAGTIRLNDSGNDFTFTSALPSTDTVVSAYALISANTNTYLQVAVPTTGGSVYIGNISVKELPGFHATQATLASRPTYGIVPLGGRRNLLERTEEFDNAYWTKSGVTVTANAAAAPDATTTADKLVEAAAAGNHRLQRSFTSTTGVSYAFSCYAKAAERSWVYLYDDISNSYAYFDVANGVKGTIGAGWTSSTIQSVGNGWYRISAVATEAAGGAGAQLIGVANANNGFSYTGDGTSGILIWGAQLETGSSATAYQRVGSAFDVTEAGVASLSYLFFEVDNFLQTPTITPGIDKVQIFAGIRKLSDAAQGIVVEHSASLGTNNGSFLFGAPMTPASQDIVFRSKGTATGEAASTGQTAPITRVATSLGDISGDAATLRINGTVASTGTSDQGTGNYLAYPMYIGMRAGTSVPFNGNLFSLIVRFGTNLDAGTITSTETWVGGKTGIDIAKWISPTIFARDETAILDRFNATIERRAV